MTLSVARLGTRAVIVHRLDCVSAGAEVHLTRTVSGLMSFSVHARCLFLFGFLLSRLSNKINVPIGIWVLGST